MLLTMFLALFIYIAWVIELSGLTRTAGSVCVPCLLHVALVFVIWNRSGVSAVVWAAVIGMLLDLLTGLAGLHFMLASTLAMAASDWREGRRCERGLTLALVATVVIASLILAAELWKGLPARNLPPAAQLVPRVLGPAAAAAISALVLRWSFQATRFCIRSAMGQGAEAA